MGPGRRSRNGPSWSHAAIALAPDLAGWVVAAGCVRNHEYDTRRILSLQISMAKTIFGLGLSGNTWRDLVLYSPTVGKSNAREMAIKNCSIR